MHGYSHTLVSLKISQAVGKHLSHAWPRQGILRKDTLLCQRILHEIIIVQNNASIKFESVLACLKEAGIGGVYLKDVGR